MIQFLRIQNLALMTETSLELDSGFTVVTGETGAGKSVLLGALSLLAGNRADKSLIRQGQEQLEVEAGLCFKDIAAIDRCLDEVGLPACEDNILVLRRSIHRSKMAKVFINGKLSTLSALQQLGQLWIDFHGPGEPQKLFHWRNQLELLDLYAGNQKAQADYSKSFDAWRALCQRRENLINQTRLSDDELTFYQSQVDKIDALELSEEAVDELELDYKRISQAEELLRLAQGVEMGLNGDDGVLEKLSTVVGVAQEMEGIDESTTELCERLNGVAVELGDLASSYGDLLRHFDFDEEQIRMVQDRMDRWLEVKRRFGPTVARVLENRNDLATRIDMQGDLEGNLLKLEREIEDQEHELAAKANVLRKSREQAGGKLSKETATLLQVLGFKKARFDILISPEDGFHRYGNVRCEYLFSANAGQSLMPLNKIASSGEVARVMLALKTLLADVDKTPVLVFDEVDANVGGEIGKVVGERLARLSGEHQVFCVTHLPQVACQGAQHFLVEKEQSDTETTVSITPIHDDGDQRLDELARMLGDRSSSSARAHAQELLGAR